MFEDIKYKKWLLVVSKSWSEKKIVWEKNNALLCKEDEKEERRSSL